MSTGHVTIGDKTRVREGNIVRYGRGRTALMKMEHVETTLQFGKRIYGINVLGERHGAYADACQKASKKDLEVWKLHSQDHTHDNQQKK